MGNQQLLVNIKFWLSSMEKSRFFEQLVGLKKQLLAEISYIVLQPIKTKIRQTQDKYLTKLKELGQELPQENDQTQIFSGYLGKYMTDNNIAQYVQRHMFKHGKIS